MRSIRILGLSLACLFALASCWPAEEDCQVEGVKLLFLCEEGVEVTHGQYDLPAECVSGPGYDFCSPEQEANAMLQWEWNDEKQQYVMICTPECKPNDPADKWCYETCAGADGQEGVFCIRGHGNQWLLEDAGTNKCPN